MSATAPQPSPRITCSCPVCGAMVLPVEAFTLVVCATDADRSFYQFTCGRCSTLVTKQASERVVQGLADRGVPTQRMPLEALEDRVGAPLTTNDLLDLISGLSDDDRVAAAIAALGGKDGGPA